MTDFGKIKAYAPYIEKDPFRLWVHYSTVVAVIGDLRRRILDVGTGDGLFPRLLATVGASVVGYDKSAEKIAEAQSHPDAAGLDVQYRTATPQSFTVAAPFDVAVSIMVLPYASDPDDLNGFFIHTAQCLRPGGKFVSIVLNPRFSAFEEDLAVRRVNRLPDNRVRMNFLNEETGDVTMKAEMNQFNREQYEYAAKAAGMTFGWSEVFATFEAQLKKGKAFWQPCHDAQPYSLFTAQKG
ncbi:MAG: methyltransferase domain-containing protein [Rhodopseudomonas sp.]|nr:methyltransferase domain-containing protein [Rhodopseudomonas sp.]